MEALLALEDEEPVPIHTHTEQNKLHEFKQHVIVIVIIIIIIIIICFALLTRAAPIGQPRTPAGSRRLRSGRTSQSRLMMMHMMQCIHCVNTTLRYLYATNCHCQSFC